MKLIVQADDYAMTDAVAEGILKCGRDGILTQTGLMTNGPHAEYYAKRILHECPHVALGLEINLVSGKPLSQPETIPSLVDQKGLLIKSRIHKQLDLDNPHHIQYKEAYQEIEIQYKKFVEITGHQPYFIGLHSYQNQVMLNALQKVQKKYNIFGFFDFLKMTQLKTTQMGPWYPLNKNEKNSNSLDYQISLDPIQMFFNECGYITDFVNNEESIVLLHTHAGYVDREVIEMSTLHMTRVMELSLLCSDQIKEWINNNRVELINIRDLLKKN